MGGEGVGMFKTRKEMGYLQTGIFAIGIIFYYNICKMSIFANRKYRNKLDTATSISDISVAYVT